MDRCVYMENIHLVFCQMVSYSYFLSLRIGDQHAFERNALFRAHADSITLTQIEIEYHFPLTSLYAI